MHTTCFRSSSVRVPELRSGAVELSAPNAAALAELLQVLTCGEESAALTFDHLAGACHERLLCSSLAGIAADEREHQLLLAGLKASLPSPAVDHSLETSVRGFFLRLADRDVLVHFVRIVAIDSATCHILGALRGRKRPLAQELRVSATFARIHRDEARHVAIASRCATPLLKSVRGRDIAMDARERLIRVLQLRAGALDSLCVDPDQLFMRLRAMPRLARRADAR